MPRLCRSSPGTRNGERSRRDATPHSPVAHGAVVSEKLLTAAELADRLALSTSTVLDWFEAGRLPGFKLGRVVRFRESEVLDWLEAQRVGPLVSVRSEAYSP